MIKSYTAYTNEIDDTDAAAADIIQQLNPEKNCLKSTVGIISCYYEFATAGLAAALYHRLNFPLIGISTTIFATHQGIGQLDCAVLMITSDDVTFTAACSSSLQDELAPPLTQMYQSALEGHHQPPKLILSAAPLMFKNAGDSYVDILDRVSGGIPHFGALAVDDSLSFENSYVIFNDKVAKDMYSIIVASGNIEPQFIYASFSPEYILPPTATVTKAEGTLIQEVNGLPIIGYMETLGLAANGKVHDMIRAIPFILNYNGENTPVSRALLSWSADGYGICGGLMPAGTKLNIAAWDKSDVLDTTIRTVEKIVSCDNISTLLLYSCATRTCVLASDILLEAKKVTAAISDTIPYLFVYSSGEICPVNAPANTNSFHNNTLVACAF